MKREDVDITKVTPMMKQYIEIKNNNNDIIIFFRLGDFYEMFFEDALIASKALELTLTGKSAGLEERIPMCGIPYHAADSYIEKLISLGHRVGICEQLEDAKNVKGIVKRDIVKIISKGTIIDGNALKEKDNNFIASLDKQKDIYILTYADISTGEVFVKEIDLKPINLINQIVSLGIKEIIISELKESFLKILEDQYQIQISKFSQLISQFEKAKEIKDNRYHYSINLLLSYITYTQKVELTYLKPVIIKNDKNILKMDVHTKRNLELVETKRLKQRQHSLLWLLDKTKTAMGGRLLKKYIEEPITDKKELERRYNLVEILIKEFLLKKELEDLLNEVYDLERLSSKIAFSASNARDLIQLKRSLATFPYLNDIFKKIKYPNKLNLLSDIYNLINKAIIENPPITIKEGYIIKSNYHRELDQLRALRKGGKDFIAQFELEEKEKTKIKNLKVGYNRVFGYYIEISKGNLHLVKDEFGYDRKQTLSNCERFISPILKEKEALILNAEEKIIELEYQLFVEIRDEIKKYIRVLQINSDLISEIDVLRSFAQVAEENNYVRPKIEKYFEIIDNRHPIIEKVSGNEFVANDIVLKDDVDIQLITGPNMSGKSTYIRQLGLAVIMAQIGSFVAAREATMPIIDAIFTRIGASDDLVSGDSTFMVEMIEANYAIENATKNSLILFDELGRGTATFDGIALTQAIIEHIHYHIAAKTLCSTHYHELTDLEKTLTKLENIHVSAYEEDGKLTFLHKIKKGSVDKSYGIHVARLANLPDNLIERAKQILKVYETTEIKREKIINQEIIYQKSELEEKIKKLNLSEITPLEALNLLYQLQKRKED